MRSVMIMYDSLNRHFLSPYGCDFTHTPNFQRLAEHSATFDTCYAGSLPCMPARRELHTGRYNFLHRSWGPLEPFDDSMPELLKRSGVHTHLCSDHTHYWEDGGATYHNRYTTWEQFRGQEGDPWKGVVGGAHHPENRIEFHGYRKKLFEQDCVNRTYLADEADHPQTLTFDAGLDFIATNAGQDGWFLQLETFDPHEPFFSYARYKALYPHEYEGAQFDWPDYAPVRETEMEVNHARMEYAALLSMCDASLGRALDLFDRLNLWQDTQLIVCTDHGYLLGEHGYWAKNYMPQYEEITHTPLFIWDPRVKIAGERRGALVQTIDLPATVLGAFGLPLPSDMQGHDLLPVLTGDTPVREAALFGIHGAHVCVTDGRYVYMKAPASRDNAPLHEYTLMPTHMAWPFQPVELKTMRMSEPLAFTKDCPVMRFDTAYGNLLFQSAPPKDLLFDLSQDPAQTAPVQDPGPSLIRRLQTQMTQLMRENDAPSEQFTRLGL